MPLGLRGIGDMTLRGNLVAFTLPSGGETRFTYDSRGFLVTITDPARPGGPPIPVSRRQEIDGQRRTRHHFRLSI